MMIQSDSLSPHCTNLTTAADSQTLWLINDFMQALRAQNEVQELKNVLSREKRRNDTCLQELQVAKSELLESEIRCRLWEKKATVKSTAGFSVQHAYSVHFGS
jgi:hypothetical protein